MHGTHRRIGAHQIHSRGVLDPDHHHAGFLPGIRTPLHAVRLLPRHAQKAAKERRMAQLGEGRARIHRGGARYEIPLRSRPDLSLGAARPRDIPRRVDRHIFPAGALSAGKD